MTSVAIFASLGEALKGMDRRESGIRGGIPPHQARTAELTGLRRARKAGE